jgi:hypothetical protein
MGKITRAIWKRRKDIQSVLELVRAALELLAQVT